jgi:cell wall-associated NlpC family hydrolase
MNALNDLGGLVGTALLVVAGLTSACASSGGARPQPFPTPGGPAVTPPAHTPEPTPASPQPPPSSPRAASSDGRTLIETALAFRGTPYRNGGSDPTGFDCSGFTQYVFALHGSALPREVQEQFRTGRKVKQDDLEVGDLVFFHTVARGASHVGIVIGDDEFVHAPSSKGVVRVERLSSSYWSGRFVGARRVRTEPAVVRRRPSGEESAVASAAGGQSGARGSRAAD